MNTENTEFTKGAVSKPFGTPDMNPMPGGTDPEIAVVDSKRPPGPWSVLWKKFSRNPFAMGGLVVLIIFVLLAVCASKLTQYRPEAIDLMFANLKPGAEGHPLGTDELGRDILSRLLYSARVSLAIGFSVAFVSVVVGSVIGAISGYFGGFVDTVFMRIVDVMNSVPTLFLNILIMALFGTQIKYMILILAFTSWMSIARLVRGPSCSCVKCNMWRRPGRLEYPAGASFSGICSVMQASRLS